MFSMFKLNREQVAYRKKLAVLVALTFIALC